MSALNRVGPGLEEGFEGLAQLVVVVECDGEEEGWFRGPSKGEVGEQGATKLTRIRRNCEICQIGELHDSRGSATRGGEK